MSDFRLQINGGRCVNRYLDQTAPSEFIAAGFDDTNWRTVDEGLGPHLSRFFKDNFIFVLCCSLGCIPMIVFAFLTGYWPLFISIILVWGLYLMALYYQERYTIPRRMIKPIGSLNEQLFNPKGVEIAYVPGHCFGCGAYFRVTPVKVVKGPVP